MKINGNVNQFNAKEVSICPNESTGFGVGIEGECVAAFRYLPDAMNYAQAMSLQDLGVTVVDKEASVVLFVYDNGLVVYSSFKITGRN